MAPMSRRPLLVSCGALQVAWCAALFAACGAEVELGYSRSELTLGEVAATNGCSTANTDGIAAQLIDEMFCLTGGGLVRFAPHDNVSLSSSHVHPYLSPAGRDRLWSAAAGASITINSALRTLAEQYVLWRGCPVAATPGNSNHETGRAIDVGNYSSVGARLVSAGFTHPLPTSDPVHYEAPGDDLRRFSVLAFQGLWNANNPGDLIDVDGAYGPQTLARLVRAPAGGFAVGRVCGVVATPALRAQFVRQSYPLSADGALELSPGATVPAWLELKNTGTTTWLPQTTFVATTTPRERASAVHDASWPSASRAATVPVSTAPGATARFTFTVRAPIAQGHYLEYFGLFHQGVGWAGDPAQGGPADDALTLRVRVGPPPYAGVVVEQAFPGPLLLHPGEVRDGVVVVRNTGVATWRPGEVFLGTAEPRDRESQLVADSWTASNRAATVAGEVAPGAEGRFSLRIRAPDGAFGVFDESFGLLRDGVAWFSDDEQGGPADGVLRVRVFVVPAPVPASTADLLPPRPWPRSGGRPASPGGPSGGCASTGGGGTLGTLGTLALALALALAMRVRARRSRRR